MSLLGYILLIPSLIGCLWGWRWVMRVTEGAWNDHYGFDGFIFTSIGLLGLMVCAAWPMFILYEISKHMIESSSMKGKSPIEAFAQRFILSTRSERKAKKVLAK